MRTQPTLRGGVKLPLASVLAAVMLVPSGCKQVEDLASKVKGEEAKDEPADGDKADDGGEKAAGEGGEAKLDEKTADPKVDPTPVAAAQIEAVPVEALHTGLNAMLGLIPAEHDKFLIARDPTVLKDYLDQGIHFADGPIAELKKDPAVAREIGDLIEAFDKASEAQGKINTAMDESGLAAKEGVALFGTGDSKHIVFNADSPEALQKFINTVDAGSGDKWPHCKAIDGREGWNVCTEHEATLTAYKPNEDPSALRTKLDGEIPGIDLEEANVVAHVDADGEMVAFAVTTIPGSAHIAVAIPDGNRGFEEAKQYLSAGEAKTLGSVKPGAGFIWGHFDPAKVSAAVDGAGGGFPPPAAAAVKSMTGDFVIAGTVDPAGLVIQAGISDPASFNGLIAMADAFKSEVPKELPEFGNAKVVFDKVAIEGGGAKADALHIGLTDIAEADVLKSYTGLHADAWTFAAGEAFTVALGPNTEGVGKLLESHGTGPSEELLAALPTELAEGLKKKEVSFAMHIPMDFMHGKQLHELIEAGLKEVPDAPPKEILAATALLAPFSGASMWLSQPEGKAIAHISVQGIGNTETAEGKVALAAAHAVVDGADPEAEFGPMATKFAASPMLFAYKARAGTDGPGYLVGSGFGAAMAAAAVAVPLTMGQANKALGDDLGVKPDDPEPLFVEPTPPKKPKTTKKPAEPKKTKKDPKKDDPKKDPKKDDPKKDPKKDDPKKDPKKDDPKDPVVEPDRPLPPKPTPDAPDPKADDKTKKKGGLRKGRRAADRKK